ncbi:valine--pyruvate transaminase [Prosthecobacter dejongeii]|uniref:Valine--pyruvate aminotransferase n=1 Tax=Prosthecobacter dejongeii TaxID=48465 RepID=A0A7W7YMB2_9BACT|nr:valine--pyruvate transaminase [Prosthecobacter dejongeii]MBB5038815.1 valine--pyruvate aminotransferase [Prosthecobacter dejongeii]
MFNFSSIGQRLSGPCGIQELMDDLGEALSITPDMRMLGGGQPAAIPAVQALWREQMQAMLADGSLDRTLLNYDPPGGNPLFREVFATFLKRECGWDVTKENIAVMPSSQSAFFLLFNLLAGDTPTGKKRILFPLLPDYIGYANQALTEGQFIAYRPIISPQGEREFKYHVDFEQLKITPDIAAMCVSCPTNPTGNVLTEAEFNQLRDLARHHGIPLMIDNAYGHPFPDVIHGSFRPKWEPGMIFSISLSKVGLPGVRTSVVVADPAIVKALSNMNAIVSLANGNVGQALLGPLLKDDTLLRLGREVIRPFYKERSDFAKATLTQALGDNLPWALHAQEGAFFLWLWLKDLPITAAELYRRLKARKVLVIPGHYFAFGLDEAWKHPHECLRLTYSQPAHIVQEALEILADEVRQAYA